MRIESREELIYLLCEAAELEHILTCSYLFSAFSLKTDAAEGLNERELPVVRGWRRSLFQVAVQEMLHLAIVNNLLTAIGAGPHFTRPNFPQMGRYYPPDLQVSLSPLSEETIQHFVYIERPENAPEEDSAPYLEASRKAAAVELQATRAPDANAQGIVGAPQDYRSVGDLYRGAERGLNELVEKLGEANLFIGPLRAQARAKFFGMPGLNPITGLSSALASIELIIEQGEGLRQNSKDTHYQRFLDMRREYRELKQARRDFEPARPVLDNPFSRVPSDTTQVNLLDDPRAVAVCDLFNASYEVLIEILIRFFMHSEETEEELQLLSNAGVDLMISVLVPVADTLTRLPAGARHPGKNAGPSFQFFRSTTVLPHRDSAWLIFRERMQSMSRYCRGLQDTDAALADLGNVADKLDSITGYLVLRKA